MEEKTDSPLVSIDKLYKSEWSNEFEQLMRNRLVVGAMRYGKINAEGKPLYNKPEEAKQRIDKYIETGNQEFLVDAANMCLLEFVEPVRQDPYFDPIDDGEHSKVYSINVEPNLSKRIA